MSAFATAEQPYNSNEWRTPSDLYCHLNGLFHFDLDAAADELNSLAPAYCKDAFTEDWSGNVFVNPPYGRGMLDAWTARMCQQYEYNYVNIESIVALLPAWTDTAWFQENVFGKAYAVCFLRGRVKYRPPVGSDAKCKTPTFASCVAVYQRDMISRDVWGGLSEIGYMVNTDIACDAVRGD